MVRHRRRGTDMMGQVKGDEPPQQLPTVWAGWHPADDGPAVRALRLYLERMDEVRGGIPAEPDELAQLMLEVYVSATRERFYTEATTDAK